MDRFRETGKKMNRKGAADAAGQEDDGQILYAASDRRKDAAKILMYFLAWEGALLRQE